MGDPSGNAARQSEIYVSSSVLYEEIVSLRREVSELRKPRFAEMISFSGLVVTILYGFWIWGIAPIVKDLDKKADERYVLEKFNQAEKDRVILGKSLEHLTDELNRVITDANNRFRK